MSCLLCGQVSKKRKAKDEKFGFGGPKRRSKQNDADSAANMEGFRQGRFSEPRGRGVSSNFSISGVREIEQIIQQ